jgi:hypothetical protein
MTLRRLCTLVALGALLLSTGCCCHRRCCWRRCHHGCGESACCEPACSTCCGHPGDVYAGPPGAEFLHGPTAPPPPIAPVPATAEPLQAPRQLIMPGAGPNR